MTNPMTTLWWGEPWPSPEFRAWVCRDDSNRIDVPAGEPCQECGAPIRAADHGLTIPAMGRRGDIGRAHFTLACFLRSIGAPEFEPPVSVYEFEVWTSTHDGLKAGVLALEVRKILVADVDPWAAYKTAVAMAWRGDRQVTACKFVP